MNNNVYKGDVQPNHKEYSIWVNNKGIIKAFDGNAWKASGIPIVEELDPTAPIGSVVCYKQTVTVDKEATKTGSIRELKYSTFESWPTDVDTNGLPIITDIQFLVSPEHTLDGCAEMLMYDGESVISIFANAEGICGFVNYDEKISLGDIKIPQSGLYYLGLFVDADDDYSPVEEQFDIFDKILTVSYKTYDKITENVVKVTPFIKQENNWESLCVANSDFNNDFNFDFD